MYADMPGLKHVRLISDYSSVHFIGIFRRKVPLYNLCVVKNTRMHTSVLILADNTVDNENTHTHTVWQWATKNGLFFCNWNWWTVTNFLVTDGRVEVILNYKRPVMHHREVGITRSKCNEFLLQLSEVHSSAEISLCTGQPMFCAWARSFLSLRSDRLSPLVRLSVFSPSEVKRSELCDKNPYPSGFKINKARRFTSSTPSGLRGVVHVKRRVMCNFTFSHTNRIYFY
jgi:hypothetical protein